MRFPFPELHGLEDAQRNFEQIEQAGLFVGSGAPAFPANKGNYYLRTDTPTTVGQRVYVYDGSAWQQFELSWLTAVSPKNFGGKGDGITDDAAAIQSAINQAQNVGLLCVIDAAYVSHSQLTCDMGKPLTILWAPGGSIHWPTDLGVGSYAIKNTGTPADKVAHRFIGAQLYGPGDGHPTTDGTAPANMHGLQLAPSAMLYGGFYIGGFWAGYTFNGDHQIVTGGKSWRNYVGEYFEPNPYGGNIGDQRVEAVSLANNTLAGIRVSCSTNPIHGAVHASVHLGFAPVGIWLERGDNVLSGFSIGGGAQFDRMYMENIGNAFLYCDDGGTQGNGTNTINGTAWRDIAGYRRADHTVSTLPEFGARTIYSNRNVYNVNVIDDTVFDYAPAFCNVDVALRSMVHASNAYRLKWLRAEAPIDNAVAQNIPVLEALIPQEVLLEGASGETYQILICTDTLVQAGHLLSTNGMTGGGLAEQVQRYVYSAGPPVSDPAVCAVAVQPPPSSTLGLHNIVCLRRGVSPYVLTDVGATFTAGQYASPSHTTAGCISSSTGTPPAAAGLQSVGYMLGPANAAPHAGTAPLYFNPSY